MGDRHGHRHLVTSEFREEIDSLYSEHKPSAEIVLFLSAQLLYSPQNQPICIPYRFYVRPTHPTKTIIAYIWLVLAVVAAIMFALPHISEFGTHLRAHRNAYRYYNLGAIEYDTKIKLFGGSSDMDDVRSFVEGDDPDGFTFLGNLRIGKHPHTEFKLFSSWISSAGVSQIRLVYNQPTQTQLTQSELGNLVLTEAALNLNSPAPSEEFERMQRSGFLNLIANNPTPITKFHPANIAADLLTLVFIAGAFWSMAYLIKHRILAAKVDETARCPTCSYPRTGLASITQCPECGQHFTIQTSDSSK